MLPPQAINHLAQLSRLELSEEEKEILRRDLTAILEYVRQLQEAGGGEDRLSLQPAAVNVLRPDEAPQEAVASPGYFKVKQIL